MQHPGPVSLLESARCCLLQTKPRYHRCKEPVKLLALTDSVPLSSCLCVAIGVVCDLRNHTQISCEVFKTSATSTAVTSCLTHGDMLFSCSRYRLGISPALVHGRTCLCRAMLVFQLLLGALAGPTPNFAQLLLGFDVEDGPEGADRPRCQALSVFCTTYCNAQNFSTLFVILRLRYTTGPRYSRAKMYA